jgi:PPM family protein phosphatase
MNSFFKIESFGISDQGLVRENNEDVWHEIPMHRFFILADGMGGHNAGEIAAKEVVHHLSTSICQLFSSIDELHDVNLLSNHLHHAILKANEWVHQLSEQKKEFSGMGTTLCCLLMHHHSLVYAHVGDSRIYRYRNELKLLTEDHSLRSEMMRLGQLDAESETSFPYKNIITRAIGTNPSVEPEISITPIEADDIYFLCSDGLTDYVSHDEIATVLQKQTDIKKASYELVNAAKAKGGNDNITIVMVRIVK